MSQAESEGVSQRTAQFLRRGLGKSDEEIERLRQECGEMMEKPEAEVLPEGADDLEGMAAMTDEQDEERQDETQTTMTETATNTVQEQVEALEKKSEEISDVLEQETDDVGIEVIDEDVPIISVNSVAMMPTEQVNRWFEDLRARMDSVAEVAQRREQERQELEEELESVEEVMGNLSGSTWISCTVDKAYKTQEKLLHNGQYCSLDPEFAGRIGVTEGDKVRVRQTDEPAKAAVYTVYEIREQDAKLRIAKKGRKRIDGKGSFDGDIAVL